MEEIKSAYDTLAEKYKLPAYEELNWEYEIGTIEEDELVIRNIRKKVTEKIEYIANILSSLIQPETEIANLHEVSFFTETDKEEIIKTYKKLMYYYRYACRLVVEDSEEENVKFILEAHGELKKMKPVLKGYFDKMKESWTKELKKSADAGYFG